MKKLIAQRPIQYMGRTYERGEAIPAHDPRMVAAWLRANSAVWAGTDLEDAACTAVQEAGGRSRVNDLAAEAIRAMGVTLEDPAGAFVGTASMEEQLHILFGSESPQNGATAGETQYDALGDVKNVQDSETPATLTGCLDALDLEKWKKADLEKLAEDLGVDISKAKSNAERAAILAAVEVQLPDTPDGGGDVS